ncbi:MAG: hypothetical protein KAV69_02265, partial [Deltaproteobacteria bacterium]|nr:hypothetical protein [Deltaproteobacteria bacterium]
DAIAAFHQNLTNPEKIRLTCPMPTHKKPYKDNAHYGYAEQYFRIDKPRYGKRRFDRLSPRAGAIY